MELYLCGLSSLAFFPSCLATSRLTSVTSYEGLEVASLRKRTKVLEQILLRKAIGLPRFELLQTTHPFWDSASLKGQVNAIEHISVESCGFSPVLLIQSKGSPLPQKLALLKYVHLAMATSYQIFEWLFIVFNNCLLG